MTVYNAAAYVAASVAAALGQSHRNYELIVFDDGSTDGTPEILQAIRSPRLRYIRGARVGRAHALNKAIEAASGEYLAINDADDLSLPERLTGVWAAFQDNAGMGLMAADIVLTERFLERIPEEFCAGAGAAAAQVKNISRAALYRSNPFVHSTVMYRKSLWRQLGGYDTSLTMCIDYDFFLRASAVTSIGWLPVKAVLYYRNPDSFFRRKSLQEYLTTLEQVRRRARENLRLPFWVRLYDIFPLWSAIASEIRKR